MNDYRAYVECDYNSIYHHGIKGQKWGVRRYQNEDGTFTEAGKKRYGRLIDLREKIDQTHPRDSQGHKIRGHYKNSPEREKLISDYTKMLRKYDNKFTGETSSDLYDAMEEHMKHRKPQSKPQNQNTMPATQKSKPFNLHLHLDPVSWISGLASKKSERLTSIKLAGDSEKGKLFIDSILFIPFNAAKRSINNSRERKKLLNNKHGNTSKEITAQRKNLQSKSQEAWNKIEEYRSKKGIEYGDDDLKLYNSDSKYKKIVDEAESIDKELREFDKKNRR